MKIGIGASILLTEGSRKTRYRYKIIMFSCSLNPFSRLTSRGFRGGNSFFCLIPKYHLKERKPLTPNETKTDAILNV